jgi:phage terminase small subunit
MAGKSAGRAKASTKPTKPTKAKASARPRSTKTDTLPTITGGLTAQQARFAAEYIKDFNGRQAAIRAGYSPKSAQQQASRLLTLALVKQAIAPQREVAVAARAEEINRMELSAERTRLEIARIAYFDPRKLFREDGKPKAIDELDPDTAAVVAGLEVLEEWEGSGEDRVLVGHIKKWKLADKNSALEKAAKILGLYEKDNDQKGKAVVQGLAEFLSSLHDADAGALPYRP